jgi:hypothetical protein
MQKIMKKCIKRPKIKNMTSANLSAPGRPLGARGLAEILFFCFFSKKPKKMDM